jgi:alpha-L-rhamnosidase
MNSFSHYSFGAVMQWAFQTLAGIDTDGPGYRRIIIRPRPPTPGSNPERTPVDWVKARYDSPSGRIVSEWRQTKGRFELNVTVPVNSTATVFLPALAKDDIRVNGQPLGKVADVQWLRQENGCAVLTVSSGGYSFVVHQQ